ncbi:MAG: hypothetical protein R2911_07520 [Caldilineaceae bacterium]
MATLMAEFANYPGSNITQHPAMHEYVVDFVTGGVWLCCCAVGSRKGMKTPVEQIGGWPINWWRYGAFA